jgi:hypothetical protein
MYCDLVFMGEVCFYGGSMFSPSIFTAKGERCIVVAYVEDFHGPYYALFANLLYE